MQRQEITGRLVLAIERELRKGRPHDKIAAELGVSAYVVRVIAGDKEREGRRQPRDEPHNRRRRLCKQHRIDWATIRRIERMLEVGWLDRTGIAREAGVSPCIVSMVSTGQLTSESRRS